MSRDDIIRMAQEANLWITSDERRAAVVRFAALVAAAERERIIAQNAPEIERVNAHIKALEDDLKQISSLSALCETLNKLHETAVQMIQPAVEMAVHKERAACANLCDEHHGRRHKVEYAEAYPEMLRSGWRIVLHGWYKEKNRWQLKEVEL